MTTKASSSLSNSRTQQDSCTGVRSTRPNALFPIRLLDQFGQVEKSEAGRSARGRTTLQNPTVRADVLSTNPRKQHVQRVFHTQVGRACNLR